MQVFDKEDCNEGFLVSTKVRFIFIVSPNNLPRLGESQLLLSMNNEVGTLPIPYHLQFEECHLL